MRCEASSFLSLWERLGEGAKHSYSRFVSEAPLAATLVSECRRFFMTVDPATFGKWHLKDHMSATCDNHRGALKVCEQASIDNHRGAVKESSQG